MFSVSRRYINAAIQQDSKTVDPAKIPYPNEPYYLVVGSGQRTSDLRSLSEYLKERLDPDLFEIEGYEGSGDYGTVEIEEGYKRIRLDPGSSLGWRIILFNDPSDCDIHSILLRSEDGVPLRDLLPEDFIERHETTASEVGEVVAVVSPEGLPKGNPKIKVKVATHQGAKGLSASQVFIIGLNDGIFPKDPSNIEDDEFRQFLVSLTRTRGALHLVTNKVFVPNVMKKGGTLSDRPSSLLTFIPPSLVEAKSYKAANFK